MNKSKSVPNKLVDYDIQPIKKSCSLTDIDELDYYFEEFFEGDGDLGIEFREIDGLPVIKNIVKGTVAAETYGLYPGLTLVNINNKDIADYNYEKVLKMIDKQWKKNNYIYLKFKKPIYTKLLKILNQHDLLMYYDNFVELGAKDIDDFEYIELDDLHKMNMNEDDIKKVSTINSKILD